MRTTLFLLISLFVSVNAVSAKTSTQAGNSEETVQTQNVNQIQTQNAGQDKKIEVQNMEILEENETIDEADQSEEDSIQKMDNHGQRVSEQVHLLLQSKLASQSGIGQQVREIAQNQSKAQEAIQSGLDKINSRPGWFKKLFGSNQTAVKNLNQQMAQNQLRIEELKKLQAKVSSQADQDMLQTAVQSLVNQNTALSQTVNVEQKRKGFFSWFQSLLSL